MGESVRESRGMGERVKARDGRERVEKERERVIER